MKHALYALAVVCLASVCWGTDLFQQLTIKAPTPKPPVVVGLFTNETPIKAPAPMESGSWKFELMQSNEKVLIKSLDLSIGSNGLITGVYQNDAASACQMNGFVHLDINSERRILRLTIACPGGITSFFGTLAKDGRSIDVGNYSVTTAGHIQMPTVGHFSASRL